MFWRRDVDEESLFFIAIVSAVVSREEVQIFTVTGIRVSVEEFRGKITLSELNISPIPKYLKHFIDSKTDIGI